MAEPRLRLVDELFEPLPDDASEKERARRATEKAVVARFGPAIIKRGRQAEREELALALGGQRIEDAALIGPLKEAHAKALSDALAAARAEMADKLTHVSRAAHRSGLVHGGLFGVVMAVLAALGAASLYQSGAFGVVAASRSANDVWAPPAQGPSLRDAQDQYRANTEAAREGVIDPRTGKQADAPSER